MNLTMNIKEAHIQQENQEQERVQLQEQEQRQHVNSEQEQQEKVNQRILQVKQNCQILMPEYTIEKEKFAEKPAEHVSAQKRQRKEKMRGSTLHKKALNVQNLEAAEGAWQKEVQKRWEKETETLRKFKQFDENKMTEQERAFAQFIELEGMVFGIHWTHYLTNIDNLEERKRSENVMVSTCINQFLKLDFNLDLRNDEAFVKESVRMDEIAGKTEALKYLLEKHPDIVENLSQEDRAALDVKLNFGVKITEYYKMQKQVITNKYYRTHYNSEISKNYGRDQSPEQNELAVLLRKAEYYKETEKAAVPFSETDLQFDKLVEILKDPAMVNKNKISWTMLFEETKDMEETAAVKFLIEKEIARKKQENAQSQGDETYAAVFLEKCSSGRIQENQARYLIGVYQDILGSPKELEQAGLTAAEHMEQYREFLKKFAQAGRFLDDYEMKTNYAVEMMNKVNAVGNKAGYGAGIAAALAEVMKSDYNMHKEKYVSNDGKKLFEEFAKFAEEQNLWLEQENKEYVNDVLPKEVTNQVGETEEKNREYQSLLGFAYQGKKGYVQFWVQDKSPVYEFFKDNKNADNILKEGKNDAELAAEIQQYNKEYARLQLLKQYMAEGDESRAEIQYRIINAEKRCATIEERIKGMVYRYDTDVAKQEQKRREDDWNAQKDAREKDTAKMVKETQKDKKEDK